MGDGWLCEPAVHLPRVLYLTEIHRFSMGENLPSLQEGFLNLNWAAWQISNLGNGKKKRHLLFELVVSTPLKNIRKIGSFPQIGVKIKKYLKPPPSFY